MSMDLLPIELVRIIAVESPGLLLCAKRYAGLICADVMYEHLIATGHDIKISKTETRWTKNGKLHRTGGPAREDQRWMTAYSTGDGNKWFSDVPLYGCDLFNKTWYKNGKVHNSSGPAKVFVDGSVQYYVEGRPHKLDGPAFKRPHSNVMMRHTERWGEGPMYLVEGGPVEGWFIEGELLERLLFGRDYMKIM